MTGQLFRTACNGPAIIMHVPHHACYGTASLPEREVLPASRNHFVQLLAANFTADPACLQHGAESQQGAHARHDPHRSSSAASAALRVAWRCCRSSRDCSMAALTLCLAACRFASVAWSSASILATIASTISRSLSTCSCRQAGTLCISRASKKGGSHICTQHAWLKTQELLHKVSCFTADWDITRRQKQSPS